MATPEPVPIRGRRNPPGERAEADPRPLIDLTERDLTRLRAEAWVAVEAGNDPPRIFARSGELVRVERSDDGVIVPRTLDSARLRHEMAGLARWRRRRAGRYVPDLPPDWLMADLLATPNPPVPILARVVSAPVFAADGSLASAPGYHASSGIYYAADGALVGLRVPERPSADELARAVALITGELLGDFPFVSEADRAHAVAALLLPLVRDLIDGPTPGHLIEAPTPGTGKSLLGRTLSTVFLGDEPVAHVAPTDGAEWAKSLATWLRAAPAVVWIDNVGGRLASDSLAAALTSTVLGTRLLGTNDAPGYPILCLWLVTANNLALSPDLARRFVRIRLDARVERPFERTGFRHALPSWALERRADLVAAVLVVVRSWLAAGRPLWTGRPLGSFEGWSAVLGGILAHAGIGGFLANARELADAADEESDALRRFVAAWAREHGDAPVSTAEVYPIARATEGLDLGRGDESAQRNALGRKLAKARGRIISGRRIAATTPRDGVRRWLLEATEPDGSDGQPSETFSGPDEVRL